MKEFDVGELAEYDGKNGKPVYVVYQGKVLDVSESRLWKGGMHMNRHSAGKELTRDIQAAPHTPEVLEKFPQVGTLKAEAAVAQQLPEFVSKILDLFPILRRHPHPMVVHFPIVFMFSATVFNLLYLITGIKPFELTALHCLAGGILFTPIAMITGWFTWWLNYLAKPIKAVTIKIYVSFALLLLQVIAFCWRVLVPDVLSSLGMGSIIYFLIIVSFIPLVSITGWFGAALTFPVEHE
jgi:predicted heme/steroid binding protein/uncharacterized membrane protein